MVSGLTSLDQREHRGTAVWVKRYTDNPACAKWPFDYFDITTGQIRPGSCKAIRCPICGPFEIKRRVRRVANARPQRFVTLTQLPENMQEAMAAEKKLRRLLRELGGFQLEWVMAHERTKKGVRHGHALQKGDSIPQAILSSMAERSGMGYVTWIERIRDDGASAYAMKEARRVIGYATKGSEQLEQHPDFNGGRLYRSTRGYFRES